MFCFVCKKNCERDIKLFKVPMKVKKRKLWIEACGVVLDDKARICAKHFRENDFKDNMSNKRQILKPLAVPSLHLYTTAILPDNDNDNQRRDINYHDRTDRCLNLTENSNNKHHNIELIHEELFDVHEMQKTSNTTDTMVVLNETLHCGIIKMSIDMEIYNINCNHCSEMFALWRWKNFVSHVKKQHCKLENIFNSKIKSCNNENTYYENYINKSQAQVTAKEYSLKSKEAQCITLEQNMKEEMFEGVIIKLKNDPVECQQNVVESEEFITNPLPDNSDEIELCHDESSNNDNYIIKSQEQVIMKKKVFEGVTNKLEKSSVKCRPNEVEACEKSIEICLSTNCLIKCRSNKNIKNKDLHDYVNNEIRFSKTKPAIVMDFLELWKTYPVLWYVRQKPMRTYDNAVTALVEKINTKWLLSLSDFSIRICMKRIKDWYRVAYRNKENEHYRCRFPKYYAKCAEFLPAIDVPISKLESCKNGSKPSNDIDIEADFGYNNDRASDLIDGDIALSPKPNEIRFGRTDPAIVMDFLERVKAKPVLWYVRQNPMEVYDIAIADIVKQINEKWQFDINDFTLLCSLNRIKEWYRIVHRKKTQMEARNGEYKCKYTKYFQKCEEFLPNSDDLSANLQNVQCDLCRCVLQNEIHLHVHKVQCHKIGEMSFQCSHCSKSFTKSNLLDRHKCNHLKESKYFCLGCQKGFLNEKRMKKHMAIHKICDKCGKKCYTQKSYKRHMVLHQPPKYKCSVCTKTYYRREIYLDHIKAHRDERNFVCEYCGKSFVRKNGLREHKSGVHQKAEKVECHICGLKFKYYCHFYHHRKRNHLVLEGTIEDLQLNPRKGLPKRVYSKRPKCKTTARDMSMPDRSYKVCADKLSDSY